jgi:hypothetical protein
VEALGLVSGDFEVSGLANAVTASLAQRKRFTRRNIAIAEYPDHRAICGYALICAVLKREDVMPKAVLRGVCPPGIGHQRRIHDFMR